MRAWKNQEQTRNVPTTTPGTPKQALALLTAASTLSAAAAAGPASAPAADDLVNKCTAVMQEYRGTIAAAATAMAEAEERQKRRAAGNAKDRDSGGEQDGGEAGAEEAVSAPAHGGGKGTAAVGRGGHDDAEVKLDVFAALRYVASSAAKRASWTSRVNSRLSYLPQPAKGCR